VYSHAELRRLLDAASSYQRQRGNIEPVTVRTIVLLLYGTGLRVGEALRLNRADVDLENSLLAVRLTKFYKSRLVPYSPQLGRALALSTPHVVRLPRSRPQRRHRSSRRATGQG